ncbi:MAG: recombination-associated protein RdgC [Deltaproteobacteria bacterium]|nr:recombination-associated protein RdgC [Deltaproteobacteria bacterium]
MGIKKGSVTFSRFEVVTDLPANFADEFDGQIRKGAFRDFFPENEEKIMGWVGLQKICDREFAYANHTVGDYRVFSLRIDKKTVPGSLLRMQASEIERARIEELGIKRLPKSEREAIKDSVRTRLLLQAPAVPSLVDVCWNLSTSVVYVSTLSDKVLQEFQNCFMDTFGLNLILLEPWLPELAGKPDAISCPGREFLTWLWFKSEDNEGTVTVGDGTPIGVEFGKRIAFESGTGGDIDAESVVCQGRSVGTPFEGYGALRRGKKIREAQITISDPTAEWSFGLRADKFQYQVVKLPTVGDGTARNAPDDVAEEGALLERIFLLELLVGRVDELLTVFLKLRMSDGWGQEQTRVSVWLGQV